MKHIKTYDSVSSKDVYKAQVYESGTYSEHDNNINKLFIDIEKLKNEKIRYEVFKHTLVEMIYFKIYTFPRNTNQVEYLKKIFAPCFFNYNTRTIKSIIDFLSTFSEKVKKPITKDTIDVIYQMQKYNI